MKAIPLSKITKTMNKLINYLLTRKGQIVTIKARRACKVKKGSPFVEKESIFQAAVGVNYDNKLSVQVKRESGDLPEKNAGLPWGKWETFPYVIEHKGKRYFRFSTIKNKFIPKIKYFLDGVEVEKVKIEQYLLASEKESKEKDCFNFPVDAILEVK